MKSRNFEFPHNEPPPREMVNGFSSSLRAGQTSTRARRIRYTHGSSKDDTCQHHMLARTLEKQIAVQTALSRVAWPQASRQNWHSEPEWYLTFLILALFPSIVFLDRDAMKKLQLGAMSFGHDAMDEVAHQLGVKRCVGGSCDSEGTSVRVGWRQEASRQGRGGDETEKGEKGEPAAARTGRWREANERVTRREDRRQGEGRDCRDRERRRTSRKRE
ncbi:hypothetical protein BC826DRAFT_974173 [Russula brevipes]|nr:hypothetical protein BC826DRAFT_974173 [Russula brevipes]